MDESAIARRLDNNLAHAEDEMMKAFRQATAHAAGRGALQSGGHLMQKAAAIGSAMDTFVHAAVTDAEALLNRQIDPSGHYNEALTKLTQLKLRGMADIRQKASWAGPSAMAGTSTEVEKLYTGSRAKLIDHQAGFGRSVQAAPSMSIQAGVGAIVQANSPGSWAQIKINAQEVRPALEEFERALSWDDLPPTASAELRAEIDTIKAQIRKAAPSTVILQEAGRSLRAIAENIAASAVQPAAMVALGTLLRTIGLSG